MTDFSVNEDELYMALLKRRAYMTAFPGTLAPVHGDVVMRVEYDDDGCCGHDKVKFFVGRKGEDPVTLYHSEIAEFLNGFFGLEDT